MYIPQPNAVQLPQTLCDGWKLNPITGFRGWVFRMRFDEGAELAFPWLNPVVLQGDHTYINTPIPNPDVKRPVGAFPSCHHAVQTLDLQNCDQHKSLSFQSSHQKKKKKDKTKQNKKIWLLHGVSVAFWWFSCVPTELMMTDDKELELTSQGTQLFSTAH